MDWPDALLFLVCAFGAEVIGTTAGFGAATILTPVAFVFMDMKTAIAIVACFHLSGNISRVFFFRRHVSRTVWCQFGLTAIACSVLGATMITQLPSALIKLLFGAFLLIYVAVFSLAGDRLRPPQHPSTLIGGGVLSGFVTGLIGTGGAIRSACLMAFGLPKEVYIATSAAIALVVDLTRIPIYVTGRFIPSSMVPIILGLIVVAFAGAWVGRRLVHRVAAVAFRRIVMTMLVLIGLKFFLEGWHGVA